MVGQIWPERENYAFSEKLGIRPKTGFLAHNVGHRCASKSIKGFIDVDCHLVFNKTLSQKNGSIGWCLGPAKGGQLFQNMSSLWRHLQKTPHLNRKLFFRFWLQDLLNPYRVCTTLLLNRLASYRIAKFYKKSGARGLKGYQLEFWLNNISVE